MHIKTFTSTHTYMVAIDWNFSIRYSITMMMISDIHVNSIYMYVRFTKYHPTICMILCLPMNCMYRHVAQGPIIRYEHQSSGQFNNIFRMIFWKNKMQKTSKIKGRGFDSRNKHFMHVHQFWTHIASVTKWLSYLNKFWQLSQICDFYRKHRDYCDLFNGCLLYSLFNQSLRKVSRLNKQHNDVSFYPRSIHYLN